MASNKARGNSTGVMNLTMKDSSIRIILRDMAHIYGPMVENM